MATYLQKREVANDSERGAVDPGGAVHICAPVIVLMPGQQAHRLWQHVCLPSKEHIPCLKSLVGWCLMGWSLVGRGSMFTCHPRKTSLVLSL
jgi:hypothetical protein